MTRLMYLTLAYLIITRKPNMMMIIIINFKANPIDMLLDNFRIN